MKPFFSGGGGKLRNRSLICCTSKGKQRTYFFATKLQITQSAAWIYGYLGTYGYVFPTSKVNVSKKTFQKRGHLFLLPQTHIRKEEEKEKENASSPPGLFLLLLLGLGNNNNLCFCCVPPMYRGCLGRLLPPPSREGRGGAVSTGEGFTKVAKKSPKTRQIKHKIYFAVTLYTKTFGDCLPRLHAEGPFSPPVHRLASVSFSSFSSSLRFACTYAGSLLPCELAMIAPLFFRAWRTKG